MADGMTVLWKHFINHVADVAIDEAGFQFDGPAYDLLKEGLVGHVPIVLLKPAQKNWIFDQIVLNDFCEIIADFTVIERCKN